MNSIKVNLKRKKFCLLPEKRIINIPSRIEELTEDQFIRLSYDYLAGNLNKYETLEVFANLDKGTIDGISEQGIDALIDSLSFMDGCFFGGTTVDYWIIQKCNFLVCENLKNTSFEAFVLGEKFYKDFNQTKKIEDMARFITCYYYAGGTFSRGKYIEKFASLLMEHYKLCNNIEFEKDKRIFAAISINYSMIREWLKTKYPNIFNLIDRKQQVVFSSPGEIQWQDFLNTALNCEKRALSPMLTILSNLNTRAEKAWRDNQKQPLFEYLNTFDIELN